MTEIRRTRTKDEVLHFLTREQMAEEIVRLDAALAARVTAAAQEGVSDQQIIDRCAAAGVVWSPMDSDGEIVIEGFFDGPTMPQMRQILSGFAATASAEPVMTIGIDESEKCRSLPFGMKLFAAPAIQPRFRQTYCQRCGSQCGPGDDGPIDCGGHAARPDTGNVGAQDEEPSCPLCQGEGTVIVPSDNGPDAYDVTVTCPHCEGAMTLEAAYRGAAKRIDEERDRYLGACAMLYGWGNRDEVSALKNRLLGIREQIRPETLDWLRERLTDLAEAATAHLAATSAEAVDQVPAWLATKAIKALNETDPEAEITIAVSAWLTEHPEEGAETVHQFKSFTLAALPPGRGMVPMKEEIPLKVNRLIGHARRLQGFANRLETTNALLSKEVRTVAYDVEKTAQGIYDSLPDDAPGSGALGDGGRDPATPQGGPE